MLRRGIGRLAWWAWSRVGNWAAIGPRSSRARAFREFGDGSAICFPVVALFGERYIRVGTGTIVGPYSSLSAGVAPDHILDVETVVSIGDRCLIGKGSGIVGHQSVVIGNDVFTGHNVYITDANHGYIDIEQSIGKQFSLPDPVTIGDGSWLGHGAIVLPGSNIGKHVVIGAGAVVTGDIPDFSVAVGNPAQVVRRYFPDQGWVKVDSV